MVKQVENLPPEFWLWQAKPQYNSIAVNRLYQTSCHAAFPAIFAGLCQGICQDVTIGATKWLRRRMKNFRRRDLATLLFSGIFAIGYFKP